jgi:NADPH-dependent 2,4-dienoyl-CoA reductase/sulfur reductase-like enzyme
MHPELFERMPASLRSGLTARLLRPGGSAWLRNLIEKHATLTEGVSVTAVTERGEQLELSLDDGTSRTADLVIIATGYRFDLGQLKFLDGGLATTVRLASGWPILDSHFCSTNRGLLFVGYPAEYRFGPLSRFVLGARFTAHRVATELAG